MVQENNLKKVIVICGPTASGKTSLAVNLAKKLNTEIISADSLLVYKGLNIGTAKPTVDEMDGVKHHLIDVVSPVDEFSVSDYERLATPILEDVISRGKIPIICGGTGFYINSLLFDLSYGKVPSNDQVREKYENIYKEKGSEYLHSLLNKVDPISAENIHYNNVKRVIRALEIFEVSGVRKSDINDGNAKKYNYFAYSYDYDREQLIDRINRRVDLMFDSGLLEEINELLKLGVNKNCQSMQAIGYREVFDYLDNKITLNELKDNIKVNTRQYAKRQVTFFKRLEGLKWLNPYDNDVVEQILKETGYEQDV